MSLFDIKYPSKRATLVKEYITGMKTVRQRNMVNREMKLAIVDELQTLFHPIVNATKQAAEETRKELASMKKTLTDIDGALTAQRVEAPSKPRPDKNTDNTFGICKNQDGQLGVGNKVVQFEVNKYTLTVDGKVYNITPGLEALIVLKHPLPTQYNSDDYKAYKSLVAQTKVKSTPSRSCTARPHAT